MIVSLRRSASRVYRCCCWLTFATRLQEISSFCFHQRRVSFPCISSHQSTFGPNDPAIHCRDEREKETWLVVGDGDLSYSASLVGAHDTVGSRHHSFDPERHQLFATVLEDKATHARIYKNSTSNVQAIVDAGQTVQFGVDATELNADDGSYDRIVFNFPHWRGKANIRRNRALIDQFLASASTVLRNKETSEIHIALRPHQGGCTTTADGAPSMELWKSSWMPHVYGAAYHLLLRRVEPFHPQYALSSHRGVDRPFAVGDTAQTYVLGHPTGEAISPQWQVAYRHELRLVLDPIKLTQAKVDEQTLETGDVVPHLVDSCVPDGVVCLVPLRAVIAPKKRDHSLLVFLIVYSGERIPLTRTYADSIRAAVEAKAIQELGLELAKPGRMVSRPFSRHLLEGLVQDAKERE